MWLIILVLFCAAIINNIIADDEVCNPEIGYAWSTNLSHPERLQVDIPVNINAKDQEINYYVYRGMFQNIWYASSLLFGNRLVVYNIYKLHKIIRPRKAEILRTCGDGIFVWKYANVFEGDDIPSTAIKVHPESKRYICAARIYSKMFRFQIGTTVTDSLKSKTRCAVITQFDPLIVEKVCSYFYLEKDELASMVCDDDPAFITVTKEIADLNALIKELEDKIRKGIADRLKSPKSSLTAFLWPGLRKNPLSKIPTNCQPGMSKTGPDGQRTPLTMLYPFCKDDGTMEEINDITP